MIRLPSPRIGRGVGGEGRVPATMNRTRQTFGFGFDPEESPYHFAVVIPRGEREGVRIEERFIWGDEAAAGDEARAPQVKAELTRGRWDEIAEMVRAQFNPRLRREGRRAGDWRRGGETELAPHLGKELTLLAWAVERADVETIAKMKLNWRGLAPEERWWLYTTVNATFEHPEHGPERGWRKAIKVAFAENPLAESHLPPADEVFQRGGRLNRRRSKDAQLALPIDGRQMTLEDTA